ncbi:hypothetical protein [Marinitoga sp. 1138]|uniref:hypothetical protein n=1 Tax=Marinitoga sp. 1138 TaxID=1643334 RepID=UPI0015862788|nr:hypothetical protein [Marinitoga sp. 1138]NUU96769.1 hypothetical protein [Marinitoga sp. 1138]
MALIKTPYNLIYNDDGSLCVTLRDDDVPFEGVKSFAVEEGTTNHCSDADPYYGDTGNSIWFDEYQLYGTKCYTNWLDLAHFSYEGTLTAGTVLTFQIEAKNIGGTTKSTINLFGSGLDSSGAYYTYDYAYWERINLCTGHIDYDSSACHEIPNDGCWYRYILKLTLRIDLTNPSWRFEESNNNEDNKYILHRKAQMEIKDFPTSFVEGSRINGQFKISKKMDYKNLVLSTWFKINKVNNPYPRIFDQTPDDTNSVDDFGFYYEQITSKFKLKANTIELLSPYISNSDVTNKWWFVVIGFDNDIGFIKLYDENSLFWDTTFTNNINNESVKQYMFKIGDSGTKQRLLNGLISNLFIGDYKDKDGNVIWTDEFIQEIYNAKKPFAVPAKIPII